MQIKKVGKRVDLNVSAQHCKHDCLYYRTWSKTAYEATGAYSGCRLGVSARWNYFW